MSVADQAATRNFLGVKFQIDALDYDANGNVLYDGIAPAGTLTSSPNWIIYKFTYDSGGRYTGSLCSALGATWDNRATTVYS